ncbi:MAG: hypothetical protein H0X51_06600 [Parachlamydiaceae bacterium]|nr:hypothetical protein [Parachlamydiaceae bacterium]
MSLNTIAQTNNLSSIGWITNQGNKRFVSSYVLIGLGYASFANKIVTFSPLLVGELPWIAIAVGAGRVLRGMRRLWNMDMKDSEFRLNKFRSVWKNEIGRGVAEVCQLGLALFVADFAMTCIRLYVSRPKTALAN